MTAPAEEILDTFVYENLDGIRRSGSGYVARCPGHDDRSPSLSVGVGDSGALLLHCFAGCETGDVLEALGLTFRDLSRVPRTGPWRPRPDPEAAKWERVAKRAMEEQWREAQPWYWRYRAAMFEWAGCRLEARNCRAYAELLEEVR